MRKISPVISSVPTPSKVGSRTFQRGTAAIMSVTSSSTVAAVHELDSDSAPCDLPRARSHFGRAFKRTTTPYVGVRST